ncbi:MAG TPA: NAD-dependent epimerase/dehydratase family protein, partial [Rhodobacteraceae bacterium]|nr:NAD-dependent epimerase/dehydratase family protein [Paracoccaceae bacterium]
MRILLTGATGFVGSHCLEALAEIKGVEVIAACRDAGRVAPEFGGEIRVGDLRNKADVDRMLQDVDVVIHAA